MKVRFVINGVVKDDVEMPDAPRVGEYVTYGASTSVVMEIEHIMESRGIYLRTIVRCSGDYAQTPVVAKRGMDKK